MTWFLLFPSISYLHSAVGTASSNLLDEPPPWTPHNSQKDHLVTQINLKATINWKGLANIEYSEQEKHQNQTMETPNCGE